MWNELKSLCCPFYSRFTLWLISRVGEAASVERRTPCFFDGTRSASRRSRGAKRSSPTRRSTPPISGGSGERSPA